MALGATVHRLKLDLADIDRGVYAEHRLTLARHPSETQERMMLRVLAFALHAHEDLVFGRGVSTDDEPDLWQIAPDGRIVHWIDLGLPDERRLRRACGRADRVTLLVYGDSRLAPWWRRNGSACAALASLRVLGVADGQTSALGALSSRAMQLSVTIQEGAALFSDGQAAVTVTPRVLQAGWGEAADD